MTRGLPAMIVDILVGASVAACGASTPSRSPSVATGFEEYATAFCSAWGTLFRVVGNPEDQKVVMLVSEKPGIPGREVGDPWTADSWLIVRDPSGDLRRQLEKDGAFADGTMGQADADQLLFSVLKAQGNPVSLDVMPGSTHDSLSDAGWKVFLAAFTKAAARD